jgi:hypothetical protein
MLKALTLPPLVYLISSYHKSTALVGEAPLAKFSPRDLKPALPDRDALLECFMMPPLAFAQSAAFFAIPGLHFSTGTLCMHLYLLCWSRIACISAGRVPVVGFGVGVGIGFGAGVGVGAGFGGVTGFVRRRAAQYPAPRRLAHPRAGERRRRDAELRRRRRDALTAECCSTSASDTTLSSSYPSPS